MEETEKRIDKSDPTRLGRERVGKLLLEFAIPSVLGMVFNMLYNIIDTAFLQYSVGDAGAAVATLAFPVMTLLMGFALLAGQGGNALAAILLGEGKINRVEKTLGNTVFLLLAISAVIALIVMTFTDAVLAVLSTPADLYEPTKNFVSIICCGYVFQSLGMGISNFLRTAGRPNLAMGTMALGTAMCIVLNYLFVMCWGWGVEGSAYATVLGQGCGMLPCMAFFMFSKKAPFRLRVRNLVPEWLLVGRIIVMGIASFVTQVGSTFVSLVFNMVVAKYAGIDGVAADTALAALGITMKATSFAFTPIVGIMIASQPIIGFSCGAKLWGRALSALKISCIVCVSIGLVFTLAVVFFSWQIVGVFGIHDEGLELAAHSLTICSILIGPVGFQIMGSSYFQSTGQPIKSAILEMSRQILILIPAYLLMPPVFMSLFGLSGLLSVAACLPFSDGTSIIITIFFVAREVRKVRGLRDAAKAAGQPVDFLPEDFSISAPAAQTNAQSGAQGPAAMSETCA